MIIGTKIGGEFQSEQGSVNAYYLAAILQLATGRGSEDNWA